MKKINQSKNADPAILARFDELCENEPSDAVEKIISIEQIRAENFTKKYGRFVCQFDVYYDFLVKLNSSINYINKQNWPKYRSVQWLILNYNLKSIYSSFNRLMRGFYDDSLILARPVYEAFIRIIYISCFPDNPYSPLISPKFKPKDGSRAFNLTNFLKELSLDWGEYNILSAMSHAASFRVLEHAIAHSKGEKPIVGVSLPVDNKMEEIGMNYLCFLIYVFLKTLETFATETNKYLTKNMLIKTKELIELRKKDFLSRDKDYWPQVMKDVDDLFFMTKRCDEGEKWKNVWIEIRKKH